MIAIECTCLEIENAIVDQKVKSTKYASAQITYTFHQLLTLNFQNDISIEADVFTAVDGLEKLHGFDDDVTEVQTMDAFSQELCLLVASVPPSYVFTYAIVNN